MQLRVTVASDSLDSRVLADCFAVHLVSLRNILWSIDSLLRYVNDNALVLCTTRLKVCFFQTSDNIIPGDRDARYLFASVQRDAVMMTSSNHRLSISALAARESTTAVAFFAVLGLIVISSGRPMTQSILLSVAYYSVMEFNNCFQFVACVL